MWPLAEGMSCIIRKASKKGDADTVGVVTRYGPNNRRPSLGPRSRSTRRLRHERQLCPPPSELRVALWSAWLRREVGNDSASSLWVRARGEIVLYDPGAIVDHYSGVRHDEDKRESPTRRAELDATYNVSLAVLYLRPDLRWRYLPINSSWGAA